MLIWGGAKATLWSLVLSDDSKLSNLRNSGAIGGKLGSIGANKIVLDVDSVQGNGCIGSSST